MGTTDGDFGKPQMHFFRMPGHPTLSGNSDRATAASFTFLWSNYKGKLHNHMQSENNILKPILGSQKSNAHI